MKKEILTDLLELDDLEEALIQLIERLEGKPGYISALERTVAERLYDKVCSRQGRAKGKRKATDIKLSLADGEQALLLLHFGHVLPESPLYELIGQVQRRTTLLLK